MTQIPVIIRDGSPESDAQVLTAAADVLRERFGGLTAGDLISGLQGASASLLAGGGRFRAADQEGDAPGLAPRDVRGHL